MSKKKDMIFSFRCMSECSISYEKIVQKSDMSKKKDFFLLRCMSECSLSYEKIVQKSDQLQANCSIIKTAASLLGHSGLKHTEKYTRAVDKLKEDAINSLPELRL